MFKALLITVSKNEAILDVNSKSDTDGGFKDFLSSLESVHCAGKGHTLACRRVY